MNAITPNSKPIDKWIPWMFVAFFVVIAMVHTVFVTVAVKTLPGVVTEDAYEKGLAYNSTLEAAKKQQSLGWTGRTAYSDGVLSYTLKDKTGAAIASATVKARITRPVTQGYDSEVVLQDAGKGVYQAKAALPLHGLWNIRIYTTWHDQNFQTDTDLTLP